MAQFDVHRLSTGGGLVLDCQSDLLQQLKTRFVVPLIPQEEAPEPARRLNPMFAVDGREFVMVTQFAAAVHCNELGETIASVRGQSFEVIGALNVLISGV